MNNQSMNETHMSDDDEFIGSSQDHGESELRKKINTNLLKKSKSKTLEKTPKKIERKEVISDTSESTPRRSERRKSQTPKLTPQKINETQSYGKEFSVSDSYDTSPVREEVLNEFLDNMNNHEFIEMNHDSSNLIIDGLPSESTDTPTAIEKIDGELVINKDDVDEKEVTSTKRRKSNRKYSPNLKNDDEPDGKCSTNLKNNKLKRLSLNTKILIDGDEKNLKGLKQSKNKMMKKKSLKKSKISEIKLQYELSPSKVIGISKSKNEKSNQEIQMSEEDSNNSFKSARENLNEDEKDNGKAYPKDTKWTPDIVKQFIDSLLELTLCTEVHKLKNRVIDEYVWFESERRIRLDYKLLKNFWYCQLHMQMFCPKPIYLNDLKIDIIEYMYETQAKSLASISQDVCLKFDGITTIFLSNLLEHLISLAQARINSSELNDCIEYLYKHYIPELETKTVDKILPKLVYENDRIICLDQGSEKKIPNKKTNIPFSDEDE